MAYFDVFRFTETSFIFDDSDVALSIFDLLRIVRRAVQMHSLFEPVFSIHHRYLDSCFKVVHGNTPMILSDHKLVALRNEINAENSFTALGRARAILIGLNRRVHVKLVKRMEFDSDRGNVSVLTADVPAFDIGFPRTFFMHELKLEQNALARLTNS